jgi:hypothetical protein
MPRRKPLLRVARILAWADHHLECTGKYPHAESGPVLAQPAEDWGAINQALVAGLRGLPGKDSLARLLQRERGRRHRLNLPRLTEEVILAWAQAHHARTGTWPNQYAGAVDGDPDETWGNIEQSLRRGQRGLPGGDSLARLLARRLGVRRQPARARRPELTVETILAWAELYEREMGEWPSAGSLPEGLPAGERWKSIDRALREGGRGLPGGSSLARLLADYREARARHSATTSEYKQAL